MNEAFGMMDEGYFKPRSEILKFINDLLGLNVTKIESLGQGAIYCQILDAMFPGKVPLQKVNWKAKLDWEFVNNLKVLQTAFTKLGIKRVIEVEKLSKCKYQDNLEMIQWLMRFYECNCNKPLSEYDAASKRKGVEPDFSFADKIVVPKIFNPSMNKLHDETEKPKKPATSSQASTTQTNFNHNAASKKTADSNEQKVPSQKLLDAQQNKGRSSSSNLPPPKALGAKTDTPMEKLDKIKKIIQKIDASDAEKLAQISKIVGIKNVQAPHQETHEEQKINTDQQESKVNLEHEQIVQEHNLLHQEDDQNLMHNEDEHDLNKKNENEDDECL
ncbi:hypothetical protein ABPG72_003751 [Tetrahymena utriculariae]